MTRDFLNKSYRNQPDSGIFAIWDHLSLFFSIEKVIVILHRNKLVPTVSFGDVLERLELPGGHLCHMVSVVLLLEPKL